MAIHEYLDRAHVAVRDLEGAVLGLRANLGSHIDVERLADDVLRCAADLSRLDTHAGPPRRSAHQPVIIIPEEEYDASLWADGDVDSEGLGVPGRRAP